MTPELLAARAGGIIFSAESVRATRDMRKTQMRRVVKPQPSPTGDNGGKLLEIVTSLLPNRGDLFDVRYDLDNPRAIRARCQPGKRYYVKETWQSDVPGCIDGISYRADHADPRGDGPANPMRWRSPLHMPCSVARYVIEIDLVRAQRLQDITEEDARAEGVDGHVGGHGPVSEEELRVEPGYWRPRFYRDGFEWAWSALHDKPSEFGKSWASNPWVFAYTYHLVKP